MGKTVVILLAILAVQLSFFETISANPISEAETVLNGIVLGDEFARRNYYHLLDEYFQDLGLETPKIDDILNGTVEDTKLFIKNFPDKEDANFVKATGLLVNRLKSVQKINDQFRKTEFEIRSVSETLTSLYEIIQPASSSLAQHVANFAAVLRKTYDPELMLYADQLESNPIKYFLIWSIRQSTTTVIKAIIRNPQIYSKLAKTYQDCLASQVELAVAFCRGYYDPDFWTLHFIAVTNKLAKTRLHPKDSKMIREVVAGIVKKLEVEESHEFVQTRKNLQIQEDDDGIYLQKVATELNQLVWDSSSASQKFSGKVMELVVSYTVAIEKISSNNKIVGGLMNLRSPQEMVFLLEDAGERLAKTLHVVVNGFGTEKLGHRADYLTQIVELATTRLVKANPWTLLRDHFDHIKANVIFDSRSSNTYLNIKLAMHVQELVGQIKKCVANGPPEGADFLKMLADVLYGLDSLQNQVDYDFQLILQETYDVKVMQMQIDSMAHALLTYAQRCQLKPDLKGGVLATQIDVLMREFREIQKNFGQVEGCLDLSKKYGRLHADGVKIAGRTDVELARFFEVAVKEIVLDLESLTRSSLTEDQDLYDIYKYTLLTFGNLMVRLKNVHVLYYDSITRRNNPVGLIQQYTDAFLTKLQPSFSDLPDTVNDATLQMVKFAKTLSRIAERLRSTTGVSAEKLQDVAESLLTIKPTNFSEYLKKQVANASQELEQILSVENKREVLIAYLIGVEKLLVHTQHVFVKSQETHSLHYLTTHIETHVHYVTKLLEKILSDDTNSTGILRTQFESLVKLIFRLSSGFSTSFTEYPQVFQRLFGEVHRNGLILIRRMTDVQELKLQIATYVQHTTIVLRQISWLLPELYEYDQVYHNEEFVSPKSQDYVRFKSLYLEFLLGLQDVELELYKGKTVSSVRVTRSVRHEDEVERVKSEAGEVLEILRRINSEKYEFKRDLLMYARQMVQTLINIIDIIEDNHNETDLEESVLNLRKIKTELQDTLGASVYVTIYHLKTQVESSIEKMAAEVEAIARFQSQGVKKILHQFSECVLNVRYHLRQIALLHVAGSYRDQPDMREKPWSYMGRVMHVPGLNRRQ